MANIGDITLDHFAFSIQTPETILKNELIQLDEVITVNQTQQLPLIEAKAKEIKWNDYR
jgi:hypothetical protein